MLVHYLHKYLLYLGHVVSQILTIFGLNCWIFSLNYKCWSFKMSICFIVFCIDYFLMVFCYIGYYIDHISITVAWLMFWSCDIFDRCCCHGYLWGHMFLSVTPWWVPYTEPPERHIKLVIWKLPSQVRILPRKLASSNENMVRYFSKSCFSVTDWLLFFCAGRHVDSCRRIVQSSHFVFYFGCWALFS